MSHRGPLHSYFRSPHADSFKHFINLQQPDPTIPLPPTPNFSTLIIADKSKAIEAAKVLRPGPTHVIKYSDGSRIDTKNTTAAAWCENSRNLSTHQLGKELKYGIFEAEYVGLILALRLVKYSVITTTQKATIILDNQGVVKDVSFTKTSSQALTHKINAFNLIKEIELLTPRLKAALRWCPGHEGVPGNIEAEKLATTAARKHLTLNYTDKPTFASF